MFSKMSTEDKTNTSEHPSASSIRRKRSVYSKEQIDILINYFQRNPYPGIKERQELSRKAFIDESRIQVWFQNRRARQAAWKKKQSSHAQINSRKRKHSEHSSFSSVPEEDLRCDLSNHELSSPNEVKFDSGAGPGEPSQETDPKGICSMVRSWGLAALFEDANSQFENFQTTMRPIMNQLQSWSFPRPVVQESSRPCVPYQTSQETQMLEIYDTPNSYGGMKPPLQQQQQDWTMGQLYSNYYPQLTQPAPSQCWSQQDARY